MSTGKKLATATRVLDPEAPVSTEPTGVELTQKQESVVLREPLVRQGKEGNGRDLKVPLRSLGEGRDKEILTPQEHTCTQPVGRVTGQKSKMWLVSSELAILFLGSS